MQAQLPQRTLLSLVLSLLLLSSVVAMPGCSSPYTLLLNQLQSQANFTEDTRWLLEPYIRFQELNTSPLRKSCMEYPSAFPSEDALRALGKLDFLHTVHATLGYVRHGLTALQKQLLQKQDFPELERARWNLLGIRNNLHCMAWLLGSSLQTAESTQAGSGASLTSPTPALPVFEAKMENCRLLWGYHHFMGLVGRVLRDWGDNPNRSRRHSPRRVMRKGIRRTRPSRRGQRPVPRGQRPR